MRAEQDSLADKAVRSAERLGITKEPASTLFSITRNRAGTARVILLIIAGFCAASLSSRLPCPWKERFLKFLVLLGIVLAVAGLVSQWILPQGKTIWWLFPVPHGRPVGCFINRNHFGGYAAMMCAPALFLLIASLEKKQFAATLTWSAGLAAMSFAVLMSLSKGAWLAFAASMFMSLLLLLLQKKFVSAILVVASLVTLGLVAIAVPSRSLGERLASLKNLPATTSASMRLSTWRDSIAVIRDYPVLGAGANAYRMVFPQYRTATTRKHFEHAENEYIQVPAEFGLPATLLIIAMLACVAVQWRKTWLIEKNNMISLCLGVALTTVATHASTDFAIRIPLYFLTVTSMIGLVLSPGTGPGPDVPGRRRLVVPIAALVIVLAVSCMGRKIYEFDSSDVLETTAGSDACRAIVWSPTSWQAWYHLGRISVEMKSDSACRFGERCITRAAQYDPKNYLIWHELCLLRLGLQDVDGSTEAYHRVKELREWKQIKKLEDIQPIR